MFYKVIACEIAFREICACAARSENQFDLEFLSQGYHDNPEIGLGRIQERIDAVDPEMFDGILLGYGLCNNMLLGLKGGRAPVVIPRAHDCITFILGSKERYNEIFRENPGTYYYTAGWLEYRQRGGERVERRQGAELGGGADYEELVEKYGEDNARYVMETLGGWTQNYSRGLFIDFDFTANLPLKARAKQLCEERGWAYEEIQGDLTLLQNWLDGRWPDDDFLVVEPGQSVAPSYNDHVIQIQPPEVGDGPAGSGSQSAVPRVFEERVGGDT
ncbi:MAG: DUF1638 domain-containing protein [Candidatus Latescibacteria bacterium]|jgi:hypothetical protein|nr:DUF1638 domain-containing protein [Candidatus Latescibacterota bacterium]